MNIFKKLAGAANPSPPLDTTQVLVALARVVHPESGRDIGELEFQIALFLPIIVKP